MNSNKYRANIKWSTPKPIIERPFTYKIETRKHPEITSTIVTLLFCTISFAFGLFVAGLS